MAEIKLKDPLLLPPKPLAPQPSDCCGTGCSPCVHDIYEQDIKAWKTACDIIKCQTVSNGAASREVVLRKDIYMDFEIINIKEITVDVYLYKFLILNNMTLGMKVGQHLVLKQAKNGRAISRQYTPISDVNERGYFEILIKIYPKGKITQIVKDWVIGKMIPWRGPFGNFTYSPNSYKHVLMLAAGTGISPMYQIITSIASNDDEETVVTLFYCSRSFSDILLRDELLELQSFWNVSVYHYLSSEKSDAEKKYKEHIVLNRLQKDDVKTELLKAKVKLSIKVLICGTKSFEKDMVNACKNADIPDDCVYRF